MSDYSLYLHIPFCRHRCAYCDFNTYAGLEDLIPAYTEALCREAALLSEAAGEKLRVGTIFFGGGTPSLLPPDCLERILAAVTAGFNLQPGLELSLEANPGTLSAGYLKALSSLGFNRLSLGMQSANTEELRLLERQHNPLEVIQALRWAHRAEIKNINLDLIFGLPWQVLETWQKTLRFAVDLNPAHLSLYALTLEHGTPMMHWAERGLITEPDPDLAAEMYEWSMAFLEQAGYVQYEISNWAGRDQTGQALACRHNLQYWRNLPYLGLGAGAHGYAAGVRTANVLAPAAYIQRMREDRAVGEVLVFPRTPATATAQVIDRQGEIGETMMMGLRLVEEGVSNRSFTRRFGQPLGAVFGKQIARLTGLGLLEWAGADGEYLRLTRRGRLLGNRVFVEFI